MTQGRECHRVERTTGDREPQGYVDWLRKLVVVWRLSILWHWQMTWSKDLFFDGFFREEV